MSTYMSKEVLEGLEMARKQAFKKKNRLRVVVDDQAFPVLRLWETGFALDANRAPSLRGLVDLYDGGRHLYQCLVIRSEVDDEEIVFDFKRNSMVTQTAPRDYVPADDAPVALLR